MKKFHFNINNFSGIFNGMTGESKNIDSFINDQIGNSLNAVPSQMFEEELLKRISIENEFRKQDVKTDKIAKSFMLSGVLGFLLIVVLVGLILNRSGAETDSAMVNLLDRFTTVIETVSFQLTSILGFSIGSQSATILLVLLVSMFLYTAADKFVFRRSAQKQNH